jgi:hypothetical protein
MFIQESKAMGAAKDTELATAIQRQSALMLKNHQLQAHMTAMTEEHAALEVRVSGEACPTKPHQCCQEAESPTHAPVNP